MAKKSSSPAVATRRRKAPPRLRSRPMLVRVGLLGLGTVGGGVAEILARHGKLIAERSGVELRLVRACVRHLGKQRDRAAARVPLTSEPSAVIAASDVDIVCELMGGIKPAQALIEAALAHGKPVVTANKAVLAHDGPRLFELAARHGTDIYFEAAVAGGLPIIRTLREGLAADRVNRIMGILNGTTNFIVSRMEVGLPYLDALREAQTLGFAEADPTLDVSGRDAADKLAILLQLAFGLAVRPERLSTTGITELSPDNLRDAAELGYRIKLLAIGERAAKAGGVHASVRPCFVPARHPLSTVPGADNCVAVESDALGLTLYQGKGAGGLPTGSAVVSDLIEAARNWRAGIKGRGAAQLNRAGVRLLAPELARSSYYVRVLAADRPGVLASIARVLGEHGVSLATVLQRERSAKRAQPVPVVMLTHAASEGAMRNVMRALAKLPALHKRPQVLRILEEAPKSGD